MDGMLRVVSLDMIAAVLVPCLQRMSAREAVAASIPPGGPCRGAAADGDEAGLGAVQGSCGCHGVAAGGGARGRAAGRRGRDAAGGSSCRGSSRW